jgi:hypothetical protein
MQVKKYGKMDEDEAYNRVKKYMTAKESDFIDPEFPLLHRLKPMLNLLNNIMLLFFYKKVWVQNMLVVWVECL